LDVDLQKIAIGIGSDVPFLLSGGAGIVRGVGDVIEQVQHEETHLVLIIPEYSCSTAAVYDSFDALGCQSNGVGNDLLLPACEVESNLQSDIEALKALTNLEVHLSGSGSTMFIFCDNEQRATELANEISQQTIHVAMATQTYMPQEAVERT
jgi:4-diphosphocytidyl-2-C-methyl-D-erythritol kinase